MTDDSDIQQQAADAAQADDAASAQPAAAAQSGASEQAPPQEALSPRERRARARAAKAARTPVGPALTPQERHERRLAERAAKAAARRLARSRAAAKAREGAHERAATPPRERVAGRQKERQGIVVSDRADKTITVRIDTTRRHRRYEKVVRTSRTLHAHDERNDAHIGDTVVVRESRPLSRTKRWRLVRIVERAG